MEHQLTLRLSADLAAKRLARKRSDVVRLALEQFLSTQIETRPIEQVRDLLVRVGVNIPTIVTLSGAKGLYDGGRDSSLRSE